jgi:2-succinyl-5-enolpyruvyl-6-hydroxy-3-cyclohexene-1-carboxylate synthase
MVRAVKRLRCPVLRIARHDPGPDVVSPGAIGLRPPTRDALAALGIELGRGDARWADEWAEAELLAGTTRDIVVGAAEWGELAAVGRICAARGFAALHCANSLSIRLMDFLLPPRHGPARVFTARGVNGTDGTLGMVLGEALAGAAPILALIGDQAFVHDLPALANPLWRRVRGALCVMNNGGGGLFDLTAARRIANYEATMRNPPAIDLAGAAQAFALVHRPCDDRAALDAALDEAARGDALHLIEIRVPPGTAARDLPRLVSATRASLTAGLPAADARALSAAAAELT